MLSRSILFQMRWKGLLCGLLCTDVLHNLIITLHTPAHLTVGLLESVDSGTRHKLSAQRLVVSASSPQAKTKTASKKKRGSNS